MNRLFSAKPLALAAVVLGGLAAATAAQARSDVVLSIGLNQPYYAQPYGYVQQAPVYVAPQPVYVQPRQVYVQPQTIYYSEPRYYDQRWSHRRHGGNRDWDRDGVPNRFDRAPGDPYRY